jgi:hypothetical protein
VFVIAKGGTTGGDGLPENLTQSAVQTTHGLEGKSLGRRGWVKAGTEKGFIGVNVTYPGQQRLIQQNAFDRSLSPTEGGKIAQGNGQRIGT